MTRTCRSTSFIASTPDNPLLNISFEYIDLAVPPGIQPFDAMRLSHINGLRIHNVRFSERDNASGPSPFAIRLNAIENQHQ